MNRMIVLAAPLALAAFAAAAPVHAEELVIKNFIGRVDMRTGDYDTVTARVTGGRQYPEADIVMTAEGVLVDGRQTGDWTGARCRTGAGVLQIRVDGDSGFSGSNGEQFRSIGKFPRIEVTAPRDVTVRVEDAMLAGVIGDFAGGAVAQQGCGPLKLGNVAGDLDLARDGDGSLEVGDVGGALTVALSGDGDAEFGRVARGADIALSGSGDAEFAAISGDVNVAIAGSGDVEIADGEAGRLTVLMTGTGEIDFRGTAEQTDMQSADAGDVELAARSDLPGVWSGEVRAFGSAVR